MFRGLHLISTEKVKEVKKSFLQESGIQFSELEEKVLQFHLSNLEYACGSTLDQVRLTFAVLIFSVRIHKFCLLKFDGIFKILYLFSGFSKIVGPQ